MDFSQIALMLVAAAGAGVLARLVKQPLLVGYLFAGLALGAFGLAGESEALDTLGKVGVALLLFLVGLEMNIHELPSIGKIALITGIGQIVFTTAIGFVIVLALGFSSLPALYIAIALAFSSTIIIVKLLSEKNELTTLHGKIAIGFLLVQDLVAVLILIFLAGIQRGDISPLTFVLIGIKGIALLIIVSLLSKRVLPRLFTNIFDTSTELVFIVSIAWALGIAALVGGPLGFSLEIGGFLAGLALSNLPEHLQVASRARPLRDFFLTIFFLVLGTHLVTGNILLILGPAILLSLFVLIGNPLIVLVIMGVLGYRKRTSFMASVTVAQISEFSLIVAAMGVTVGHITQDVVALVIMVAVITMTVSTYMILGAESIFEKLKPMLRIFERRKLSEIPWVDDAKLTGHIILVGSDRTGSIIRRYLKKSKHAFIVIDYNPTIVKKLTDEKVNVVFGDITDDDVFAAAHVEDARLFISTTTDPYDTSAILERIGRLKTKPQVIVKANSSKEALAFYDQGASYVIVPEVVAGEHIRHIIKSHGVSEKITKLGVSHKKRLQLL